jgi:putative ABC transport system permease protein
LTLSLAAFTASMARTLDSHLSDQVFYDTGADMRVVDLGQAAQASSGPGGTGGGAGASGAAGATDNAGASGAAGASGGAGAAAQGGGAPQQSSGQPTYLFLPVTEYLKLPGVTGATRVTRSPAEAQAGDSRKNGTVLGIDRMDFPGVAHWRSDYAPQSLGALTNALGANPNGILVSRQYLREQGLKIGSKLNLQLHDVETAKTVPFVVVGELDYFPTLYSEDGPFFVANADYLFEAEGGLFPYEVWLDVKPGTTKQQIELAMFRLELHSIVSDEAPKAIVAAEDRPERQGLYGLLSVGFLASALLTGLGFLFYSVISFQRRFIELGMLRAIGLSVPQMGLLLLLEQGLIIGMGILAGTVLGVGVSRYFIRFLQVRGGEHPQTPPFVVLIAWDQIRLIYLIFAVLLGLALAAVATLLLRMKIFQAVKLGESV